MWCCLRFWQWIKRQHGNWGSSVRHYHPALTRRTAWPLGRNDIQRHVWRVIGRVLRLHGRSESCEQESSYDADHPCLRSSSNVVDTGPFGAGDLATQGKLQSEIARTLGVSIMTLHRWRKMSHAASARLNERDQAPHPGRIAELQLENSRLRRLVTDLLLEKMKLEEASQVGNSSTRRASR